MTPPDGLIMSGTMASKLGGACISKSENTSDEKLFEQQKKEEDESVAMAFQLAKQNELAQKQNNSFWGELKQITGW
jgi:hypothetical protein